MALEIPPLPVTVGSGDPDVVHTPAHSHLSMTQLMNPQDANVMGNVFGGVVLASVDRIAYVCATRHADRQCVTASFDQVDFRSPIEIGEIVTLFASVNTVGRTSIEVGVRVEAESVQGEERRHTNSCYVTMVALDERRRPVPVPRLLIRTEAEYRRHLDAEERRRARLKLAAERRERWKP